MLAVLAEMLTEVKDCVKVPLRVDPFSDTSNEMRPKGEQVTASVPEFRDAKTSVEECKHKLLIK